MSSEPTKILCILRSGGDFTPNHVRRLAEQLRGNIGESPIVCLTDQADEVSKIPGVAALPLEHDWPSYWCKMEMYKIPGPALYLDLDVTVTGDLDPFLYACQLLEIVMNRDFWRGQGYAAPYINAAVVGWAGDPSWIYEKFRANASELMAYWQIKGQAWKEKGLHSDQGMLVEWIGHENIEKWQWVLPGMLFSFKNEVRAGADISDMRLCVSHGQPRPWAPDGADQWLLRRRAA